MPDGPVVSFPGGLTAGAIQEIFTTPVKYKCGWQNQLKEVFKSDSLHAGFGNKDTVINLLIAFIKIL